MTQPSRPGGGLPEQSRVVLVTGASAGIDFHTARDYVGIRAHARAKLLTAAWTLAMSRQQAGTGVVAATVNPGMAWTAMADPAFQDQVVRTARDLARDAATAAGHRGRP